MSPILIFRHIEHEGPGYLGDFFRLRDIPYEIIRVDANESIPDRLNNIRALVFMGGPMSVNDPLTWIEDEISLIRQAFSRNLPVLGHCLGGQLMARALGAKVSHNRVSEIGWHDATRIKNPASDDWLAGMEDPLELFHWHSETFAIPSGASPLLKSRFCENQAFVSGNSLAMQCHIEMTEELVKKWVAEAHGKLETSVSVQSGPEMLENLGLRIRRLNRIADRLYERWIQGI